MSETEMEKRLAAVEREIAEIKAAEGPAGRSGKWYVENAGQFKNDPVYAEIVRLGRKYRESLRPKRKRAKKR